MLRTAVVLLSCAALGAFAAPARGVTVSYSANLSTSKGNPVPFDGKILCLLVDFPNGPLLVTVDE